MVIDADALLLSPDSEILTESLSAPPELDLAGNLVRLPQALVQAEALLQRTCAALLTQEFSSFVRVGRGGTPLRPDGWTPSFERWYDKTDPNEGDKD